MQERFDYKTVTNDYEKILSAKVRGHPGTVRPGALDGDIALEGIEIAVAYIVVSEAE